MFDSQLQLPLLDAKDRLDLVRRHGVHPEPARAGPRVYQRAPRIGHESEPEDQPGESPFVRDGQLGSSDSPW